MGNIQKIKALYLKVPKKERKGLYSEIAKEFGMAPESVRVSWFNRYTIPAQYNVQNKLITFLENYVKRV